MVGLAQFRNRLEDRRGKDDKISRGVWETVKANAGKIRMVETEGERGKGRSRKEIRKERREKEAKERENSRSKKGSGRIENMR